MAARRLAPMMLGVQGPAAAQGLDKVTHQLAGSSRSSSAAHFAAIRAGLFRGGGHRGRRIPLRRARTPSAPMSLIRNRPGRHFRHGMWTARSARASAACRSRPRRHHAEGPPGRAIMSLADSRAHQPRGFPPKDHRPAHRPPAADRFADDRRGARQLRGDLRSCGHRFFFPGDARGQARWTAITAGPRNQGVMLMTPAGVDINSPTWNDLGGGGGGRAGLMPASSPPRTRPSAERGDVLKPAGCARRSAAGSGILENPEEMAVLMVEKYGHPAGSTWRQRPPRAKLMADFVPNRRCGGETASSGSIRGVFEQGLAFNVAAGTMEEGAVRRGGNVVTQELNRGGPRRRLRAWTHWEGTVAPPGPGGAMARRDPGRVQLDGGTISAVENPALVPKPAGPPPAAGPVRTPMTTGAGWTNNPPLGAAMGRRASRSWDRGAGAGAPGRTPGLRGRR